MENTNSLWDFEAQIDAVLSDVQSQRSKLHTIAANGNNLLLQIGNSALNRPETGNRDAPHYNFSGNSETNIAVIVEQFSKLLTVSKESVAQTKCQDAEEYRNSYYNDLDELSNILRQLNSLNDKLNRIREEIMRDEQSDSEMESCDDSTS